MTTELLNKGNMLRFCKLSLSLLHLIQSLAMKMVNRVRLQSTHYPPSEKPNTKLSLHGAISSYQFWQDPLKIRYCSQNQDCWTSTQQSHICEIVQTSCLYQALLLSPMCTPCWFPFECSVTTAPQTIR